LKNAVVRTLFGRKTQLHVDNPIKKCYYKCKSYGVDKKEILK